MLILTNSSFYCLRKLIKSAVVHNESCMSSCQDTPHLFVVKYSFIQTQGGQREITLNAILSFVGPQYRCCIKRFKRYIGQYHKTASLLLQQREFLFLYCNLPTQIIPKVRKNGSILRWTSPTSYCNFMNGNSQFMQRGGKGSKVRCCHLCIFFTEIPYLNFLQFAF